MKLVFLILAHERPAEAAELAETLVRAGSDAVAYIHYDVRRPAAEFEVLRAAAAREPRLRLVEKRVTSAWGSYGLVEAPMNAFAQIEAEGCSPDYVVLLSGACLPCRPVAQLERFLAERAGREFIELGDESWVGNGWRSERWRYRFRFDPKSQRPAEWAFFHVQRLLGIERHFPEGLKPAFGSQWWTLTWDTIQVILRDVRRDPARWAFFRHVWIPDEMAIQTYVAALVDPGEVAGFGLTHFQFSNRGKPVVFHDDHADYVRTLDRFFLRKVSPDARRLRAQLLACAAEPDDGADFDRIGTQRRDYAVKVGAQVNYPAPGQIFYRDQRADMDDTVLARIDAPYVVLLGPPALTCAVARRLPEDGPFAALGAIFHPRHVDFGPGRETLEGLLPNDAPLRDIHPALYLARVRQRCQGVPAMLWSPAEAPETLAAVLRDPAALCVACLPFTGAEGRDRLILRLAAEPWRLDPAHPTAEALGLRADRLRCARLEDGAGDLAAFALGGELFYGAPGTTGGRGARIAMPWHPADDALNAEHRRHVFETSLAECRFSGFPWFPALRAALETAWSAEFAAGAPSALNALPPSVAAELAALLANPDGTGEAPHAGASEIEAGDMAAESHSARASERVA